MPDTPENQAAYPQHGNQKKGVGFPIGRMVGVLCLGSGAVLGAALGAHKGKNTGEHALLRQLLDCLEPGDILLGDRYYASYWLIAVLSAMGVSVVFGQHGTRKTDFRKGERLGKKDHIVTWKKPAACPDWMDSEQYDGFPEIIRVRECKINGTPLVTTLLSPRDTPKPALFELYKQRWHVELDLRNIKTTLGMESLSCKTPAMNEKEMWVYFLAYNLIRLLMCEAALRAEIMPRLIGFKHTLQIWLAWNRYSGSGSDDKQEYLFVLIAQRRVGNRPNRIEPRAVKKRPKAFPKLNQSRYLAREDVRRHGQVKRLK